MDLDDFTVENEHAVGAAPADVPARQPLRIDHLERSHGVTARTIRELHFRRGNCGEASASRTRGQARVPAAGRLADRT